MSLGFSSKDNTNVVIYKDEVENLIKKYKPVILYERKGHEARYGFDKNIVLEILKEYGYKELVRINNKNALIGVR